MKKRILKTKNKKIFVQIYNQNKSDKNPIIFLPGYNMRVSDYKRFIENLDKKVYGIDYLVSKPSIKYFEGYIDLVLDAIKKLRLKNYIIIGHSLGGGASFFLSKKLKLKKAIAINPLSEVDYELCDYKKKFLKVAKYNFFRRIGLDIVFVLRYLSNFKSLDKLYKSLNDFKIPFNIKTDFLILLAEKDEFFNKKYIPRKKFRKLKIILTPGRHFNLVHFSEDISKKVRDFCN